MCDIADQGTVFLFCCHLLFGGFLQTLPHLLKVPAQISHLILFIIIDGKIQISLFDIFRSDLQFLKRHHRSTIDPDRHNSGSQRQDQQYRYRNIDHQPLDLRLNTLRRCNDIDTALIVIASLKIYLFQQRLCIVINIISGTRFLFAFSI